MERIQMQINTNIIWLRLQISNIKVFLPLGSVVMWLHPLWTLTAALYGFHSDLMAV